MIQHLFTFGIVIGLLITPVFGLGSIYSDIELNTTNPGTVILNQHYRIQLYHTLELNEYSAFSINVDTGLFDWDSDLLAQNRRLHMVGFNLYQKIPIGAQDFDLNINYGKGESIVYNEDIYFKEPAGFKLKTYFKAFSPFIALRVKPISATAPNIKQVMIGSSFPIWGSHTLSFLWDYTSQNTADLFNRSVPHDEKISLKMTGEQKLKYEWQLAAKPQPNELFKSIKLTLPLSPKTKNEIYIRYIDVPATFFDSSLQNYFTDYDAISVINRKIDNATQYIEIGYTITDKLLLAYTHKSATSQQQLINAVYQFPLHDNQVLGIDYRIHFDSTSKGSVELRHFIKYTF